MTNAFLAQLPHEPQRLALWATKYLVRPKPDVRLLAAVTQPIRLIQIVKLWTQMFWSPFGTPNVTLFSYLAIIRH